MTLKCCKKNLELIAHHSAYLHGISIDIYVWWCSCFFPFLQIIVRMCSLFNELCLNMFGSIEFISIEWLSISLRQCEAEKNHHTLLTIMDSIFYSSYDIGSKVALFISDDIEFKSNTLFFSVFFLCNLTLRRTL